MNPTRKKSFFVAVICLILCVALLVGTTFAWFTDSVSNTGNRIQAGTLDVDLLMYKTNTTPPGYASIAGGTGDIFKEAQVAQNSNETLWEPGKTQIVYLAVENKGNLALKYKTCIDVTDNGLVGSLEYALLEGTYDQISPQITTTTTWADVVAKSYSHGDVEEGRKEIATGVLDEITKGTQNETDYVALAVHMKEDAGNQYQGKDIVIDVNILAAQLNAEIDGFNSSDYDKNATYDSLAPYISKTTTQTVAETGKAVSIGDEVATSTVPAAVQKEGSAEMIQVKKSNNVIDSTAKNDYQMVASSSLTRSIETTVATANSVTYDISYVYTEGTASYNVSEFASIVTNEIRLSKGLKDVNVTHSHGGIPESMTKLNEKPATTPTVSSYYYDESDGKLYIWSAKYSEYTITYRSDFVASIGTTGYTDFYDALDAAKANDTIVLLSDITVNNKDAEYDNFSAINIEKAITIDGKGHSITGKDFTTATTNSVISITNYPTPIAGTVTLKNLTVNADGEAVKHCINVYGTTAVLENITVNMKNGSKGYAVISNGANGVSNVTIKGEGTVINAGTWGALNVDQNNGSSITLEAGTINGLVNVERGLFTMTGGTIKSTYAVNVKAGAGKTSVANISGGTVYGSITKDTKGGETISITGGTFSQDPSAYVASGYVVEKVGDMYNVVGTWMQHAAANYAEGAKDPANKTLRISTKEELALFSKEIYNKTENYSGYTITIDGTIDLGEYYWIPINGWATISGATVTGANNAVIKNMKVISSVDVGAYSYYAGFIGQETGPLTIKDLTFDSADVNVANGSGAAVVVGLSYGNVNMQNITVKNSKVSAETKAGLFLGFTGGDGINTLIDNCSAVNSTVTADYSYALMAGLVNNNDSLTIKNSSADTDSKSIWSEGYEPTKMYKNLKYGVSGTNLWLVQDGLWAEKRSNPNPTAEIEGTVYTIKGDKVLTENGTIAE